MVQIPMVTADRLAMLVAICGATIFLTAVTKIPADAQVSQSSALSTQEIVLTPSIDPELAAALDVAIRNNPSIRGAVQSARAAGYDLSAAKWQRFPSFSVEMFEVIQQHSSDIYKSRFPIDSLFPTVSIDQPLWSGGRIAAGIDRAGFARDASLAFSDATTLQVAIDISDAFYQVSRLSRRQVLLRGNRTQHLEMITTMERRAAAGVSPLADLELARGRLAQVEEQLARTTFEQTAALERLRNFIADPGFTITSVGLPPTFPTLDPVLTLTEATKFSPRLRQLNSETKVADTNVQLARAAVMPQLSAQYSYNDYQGSRIGIALRYQLGSGLARISEIDAAKARRDVSQSDLEAARLNLRNRVLTDVAELASSTRRLAGNRDAAHSAKNVHEAYLRQFISARRSWLDVMNAFQEQVAAEIAVVDTESTGRAAMARLMLLTGRWRLAQSGNRR
jgi:adhesin transport system outer membrane protein